MGSDTELQQSTHNVVVLAQPCRSAMMHDGGEAVCQMGCLRMCWKGCSKGGWSFERFWQFICLDKLSQETLCVETAGVFKVSFIMDPKTPFQGECSERSAATRPSLA